LDIERQCGIAVQRIRSLLDQIDANTESPVSGMVKTEKGWGFLETDPSPMNLVSLFLDGLQSKGRFVDLENRLPFIEGDSFVIQLEFKHHVEVPITYYIRYVMA
jgi:hypothetical protein